MKIGIVTVYNSFNCGSFLQAYALYNFLRKHKGCDVAFLKRNRNLNKRNIFYYRLAIACKLFLRGKRQEAATLLKMGAAFRRSQKLLPVVTTAEGCDLLIYGSDTIWNLEVSYFLTNWARYWGDGVTVKKITYAASVGSTPSGVFYADPKYKKLMNEFAGVAVRDERTYEMANTLLEGRTPQLVVDPTMLVPLEEFQAIAKPCKEKDFILVYYFGNMPKKLSDKLNAFAKAKNKKIITFGTSIPFDPGLMLGYYEAADYVVTNTFHGNVFAVLYNKNFVGYGKEKSKVKLLLEEFGLSERLLDFDDDCEAAFQKGCDFTKANSVLLEKRQESASYLEAFLA